MGERVFLQNSQYDLPPTMPRPVDKRSITTFRKLPKTLPIINASNSVINLSIPNF